MRLSSQRDEEIVLDQSVHGQVFACTDGTEREVFKRSLFGTNRVHAPGAMRVKAGDFLFLLNLDSDLLHGVFRAISSAGVNIEPDAWHGSYPYQVRVSSIGETVSLKNAKRLLTQLAIRRSAPFGGKMLIRLLELYRPDEVPSKQWLELLSKSYERGAPATRPKKAKSWGLLSEVVSVDDQPQEEIPTLEATTLWDFPKQSYGRTPKGNNKYAGVTPAELIWNLVWKYTEPGELVLDPMAGSGTTIDVCREEGRRVIAFDIAPVRPDITRNDARNIPLDDNSVDMVFIDSPYGDNVRYNDDPNCIGKISSETEIFYDELEKVAKECHRMLKPGRVLGWLIGDQWVKKRFTPVGFKLYGRLSKYFETVDIVCIVRRGQSSHTGVWFSRARRLNFFLRGFKYLFIMRKPDGEPDMDRARTIKWKRYPREQQ